MPARLGIFLDSNAGTPLLPEVAAALSSVLNEKHLPNPSSIHSHGRSARRLMATGRESIALSLGNLTDPEQLVFTSSGTEANQLAIRSVLEPLLAHGRPGQKPHWITTPVEHDSILQMVSWLQARGGEVSFLPVDADGCPDPDALGKLFRPQTALVSAVWVNNETGVITDVAGLAQATSLRGIPLHLDAAQAWGKLPFQISSLGASLVTFSAHKIGAPAGTGVLWINRGVRVGGDHSTVYGKQEKSRRGGTENLLGIVGTGAAARTLDPSAWSARVAPLRDRLQNAICERIPGTQVNGIGAKRVANTLNLSFEGVGGDGMVMALDLAGFSVSAGSACASGVLEPSHVLLAMGRTPAQATAAIRVSLVDGVPLEDLEMFVDALEETVIRFRRAGLAART